PATSASSAPAATGPVNPHRSLDVPDCALGTLRAATENLVYSRILDDAPERALEAFDKVIASMPADACKKRSPSLPPWPKLRETLVKRPEKPLARHRALP